MPLSRVSLLLTKLVRTVILTRFSRVTFSAAHKYLGLTTEVLRTEKAINDIACHPLPASFYEGGGLQYLRQRFDSGTVNEPEVPVEKDYFNYNSSPSHSKQKLPGPQLSAKAALSESPAPLRSSPFRLGSRTMVQAGDLHSTAGQMSEVYRPLARSFSIINTPHVTRMVSFNANQDPIAEGKRRQNSGEDFDLREEVMSCIAKSIGLLQPPMSEAESIETSPVFTPSDPGGRSRKGSFDSSFSSLSLLDIGDDTSSMTGGSSSILTSGDLAGVDNEVEILFFAAGSTLAKAEERNTGTS